MKLTSLFPHRQTLQLGALAALTLVTLAATSCRAADADKPAAKKPTVKKPAAKEAPADKAAPPGMVMLKASERGSYGQYKQYPTRTLETLSGFKAGETKVELDKYGGWKKITAPATGFFYTKKIDGRFWLIDPEGNAFLHVAIANVIAPTSYEWDMSDKTKAMLAKRYGPENALEKWAAASTKLLVDNGFNGTGAWTMDKLLRATPNPLPYTRSWNFMGSYGKKRGGTFSQPGHTGYPKNAIFVFDPEFETFADEYAKQLAETKDDPYLLGHFSDNEMPWPKTALDNYLSLPAADPGHIAAQKWLDARPKKEGAKPGPSNDDRQRFIGFMADRYFSIVSKAIKKYDPNHLYLGARFYGGDYRNGELFKAVGKYADVVSVNYYNQYTPDQKQMSNWLNWSGKPFMITEYQVFGADTGMPNGGNAYTFKTQAERGLFYQNFSLALLEHPACVGWHFFKWMDNDPENKKADASNRNANKGVVNIQYEPYTPFLENMKKLNHEVYPLAEYFAEKK